MKIYTSYFDNVKKIREQIPDMCLVSVAGKTPKWVFDTPNCYSYKSLAPKYEWWKEWHDKFSDDPESVKSIEFYGSKYCDTVLGKLNADAVRNELERLAYGADVCLLCYETPEKFCHRHLICNWLKENNIDCMELDVDEYLMGKKIYD